MNEELKNLYYIINKTPLKHWLATEFHFLYPPVIKPRDTLSEASAFLLCNNYRNNNI